MIQISELEYIYQYSESDIFIIILTLALKNPWYDKINWTE